MSTSVLSMGCEDPIHALEYMPVAHVVPGGYFDEKQLLIFRSGGHVNILNKHHISCKCLQPPDRLSCKNGGFFVRGAGW